VKGKQGQNRSERVPLRTDDDVTDEEQVYTRKEHIPHYTNMPNWIYLTVSLILYSLVVIAAITLGDIGVVFGIVGSTAVSFVIFLGPAGYYLKGA
jgi:hypothetical protein